MEKSDCLQVQGQHEITMEQESFEENRISQDEISAKLNYIKQEVHIGSEGEEWSGVLSSPTAAGTGSKSIFVDPLELTNNYMDGQHPNTDVDGWINDGIWNALPTKDNALARAGVVSLENSHQHQQHQQRFQQTSHEDEHSKRPLLRCFHCSRSFSSEDSLAEHMKTHAGQGGTSVRSPLNRGTFSGEHGQGQNRGRQGPKTTFPWTEEQEEDLVSWWRLNECLYNGNCHGYLSRPRREKLFAAKAKEIGSGCTSEDIQTHLRSLRTKLNHILKDYTGSDGWEPRTPRGRWVWDRLHFIIPFIIQRNNTKTKFGKGSSGEDSPSGGSDVSIGLDTIVPETSNEVVSVSTVRERYAGLQSKPRGRGRPRGARHHIPPKQIRMDIGTQGQLLRTKSTTCTSAFNKSLMTYNQHTSVSRRHQLSVDASEAPSPSTSQISTYHHPTTSMANIRKPQLTTSVADVQKHRQPTSIGNVCKQQQPTPSLPVVSAHTRPIHNASTHTQPMASSQPRPITSTQHQPTTSSQTQPVSSSDEEEVKAFLGHLKCTLLRIPADLRMEVQADILAMVYARHKEHRQSCMPP